MKRLLPYLCCLTLLNVWLYACEKDDICVEGDTPQLIITFYNDTTSTETKKQVTTLKVTGLGVEDAVPGINRVTTDSILVPLKSLENNSSFVFISNSAEDTNGVETGNADTLQLNYTVFEKFISRACGYVANYKDLSANLNTGVDNWISNIEIVKDTVENEISAHVKIYH